VVHFSGCLPALVWKATIERSWIGEGGGEGNQHFEDKIARFTPSQIQEPFVMGEKIVMGVNHG